MQALATAAPANQYNQTQLVPWKGYCVKNLESYSITIEIPPVAASGAFAKKADPSEWIEGSDDWVVQIKAECAQATDWDNYLGCLAAAEDEWDAHDFSEAPPIGDYVALYFPHEEWQTYPGVYAGDFRMPSEAGVLADFVVATNIVRSEVCLSFENLDGLPDRFVAMLVDEKAQRSQDLRENNEYTFLSGTDATERELRLIVGEEAFIRGSSLDVPLTPSEFHLFQNYPNPFNPATTIQYALPRETIVTLTILDVLGRQVISLEHDEPKAAGYHAVIWDGADAEGIAVPSGIYIVHLRAGEMVQQRKIMLTK